MGEKMKVDVEDTYCEAFDGLFARFLVTAVDEKRLRRAAIGATALPSTVFGKSEGGVERWVTREDTPDGRLGAIIQVWVNQGKHAEKVLEEELSWRIRQGILVVPSTVIFNALDSPESIDMMNKVGHCGDGYEWMDEWFGREVINIPIMMPDFKIERRLGYARGVMGGNLWFMCDGLKSALRTSERAIEAISTVEGVITPFEICSAGSKPETNFPEIGPTTNHLYCPTLRGKIEASKVPGGVESIPEIVINGISLSAVKTAMKEAVHAVDDVDGLIRISAGNYGGRLGRYKIFLRELLL